MITLVVAVIAIVMELVRGRPGSSMVINAPLVVMTIAIQLPKLEQLLDESSDFVHDVRPSLASTLDALSRVAHQLGVDQRAFAASLQEIPKKMRMMARTGSYGSYFNFFVCGLEVRIRLGGGTLYLGTPSITSNETDSVCQESDGTAFDGDGEARR